MREAAQIVLQLLRYANREDITLGWEIPALMTNLQITREERDEISEIIKADIRELNASFPGFAQVTELLSQRRHDANDMH